MKLRAMAATGVAVGMLAAQPAVAADAKMSWPDWLVVGAKQCNKSYGLSDTGFGALVAEGRTLEQADALFNKLLQDKIGAQQSCLTGMKQGATAEQAAAIDRAVAATYADLHGLAAPSRSKFIANPAGYTMIGRYDMPRYADYAPVRLTAALGTYAELKTLEQSCGSYALVSPKAERAAIEKAWTAAQPYIGCVKRYHQASPPFAGYFGAHIRVVGQHVRGFAPFLCSKWKQVGCIEDAAWQELATIATSANAEIAKAGDALWDSEKRSVEFFASKHDQWAEELQDKAASIGMK